MVWRVCQKPDREEGLHSQALVMKESVVNRLSDCDSRPL